jgi:hypothetical protein
VAPKDPQIRLTRENLMGLAATCDRLGDQASPEQIAAMAANMPGASEEARTLLRVTTLHFLEWLEVLWRETPTSRGEMIRSMIDLQDRGVLDESFNPTPEGWNWLTQSRANSGRGPCRRKNHEVLAFVRIDAHNKRSAGLQEGCIVAMTAQPIAPQHRPDQGGCFELAPGLEPGSAVYKTAADRPRRAGV